MALPINPTHPTEQTFCDLVADCDIKEIAFRIGEAVYNFFSVVVVLLYQSLAGLCMLLYDIVCCICCDEEDFPALPPPPRVVTPWSFASQVAHFRSQAEVSFFEERRKSAIDKLKAITPSTQFSIVAPEYSIEPTLYFVRSQVTQALNQYRRNLIKEITGNKSPLYLDDFGYALEFEVDQILNNDGTISQFRSPWISPKMKKDLDQFVEKYDPVAYLQKECRTYYGDTPKVKTLRCDLLSWATTHYKLDGDDPLSQAISEDPKADAIICGGNLTTAGVQFLLESAGIFKVVQRKTSNNPEESCLMLPA